MLYEWFLMTVTKLIFNLIMVIFILYQMTRRISCHLYNKYIFITCKDNFVNVPINNWQLTYEFLFQKKKVYKYEYFTAGYSLYWKIKLSFLMFTVTYYLCFSLFKTKLVSRSRTFQVWGKQIHLYTQIYKILKINVKNNNIYTDVIPIKS